MLKKEIIYEYMLTEAIEGGRNSFTQLEISKKFGFSLSTVNNALKPLESMGAIRKKPRSFALVDRKKALLYWATIRKFEKDIIYRTRVDTGISDIEKLAPFPAVFTAYSAYRMIFRDAPADYSEVYFYLPQEELAEVKKRFPERRGPPNLFVLRGTGRNTVSKARLFVDLWNLKSWHAEAYLKALERRLDL